MPGNGGIVGPASSAQTLTVVPGGEFGEARILAGDFGWNLEHRSRSRSWYSPIERTTC